MCTALRFYSSEIPHIPPPVPQHPLSYSSTVGQWQPASQRSKDSSCSCTHDRTSGATKSELGRTRQDATRHVRSGVHFFALHYSSRPESLLLACRRRPTCDARERWHLAGNPVVSSEIAAARTTGRGEGTRDVPRERRNEPRHVERMRRAHDTRTATRQESAL